ncbi:MAG TPA: ACT domain-containing protein [Gemmatimonadaceae bacterium]|nr:ACT domain-containing protein [Gemmatimonadaceae bacterium]
MNSPRSFLILAALGADQPGLAARVARYVAERGGNVEDSRMVALGGVFGLMLLISAPPDEAQRIARDAAALEREAGMRVTVQPASDPGAKGAHTPDETLLAVTASAFDREGLIMEISDIMRSTGGNIVEMETTTYDDPVRGGAMFQMDMTVSVAAEGDVDAIRDALASLTEREHIQAEVKRAESSRGSALARDA